MAVKPLPPEDPRATMPLYTIREAASYLDVPVTTLHSWIKPPNGEPLVYALSQKGKSASIPFIGFAEAFVVSVARRHGLSTRELRDGVNAIRADWEIEHALANRLIY